MLDHFKQFPDLAVSLQIAELGKSCHELLPQLHKKLVFKISVTFRAKAISVAILSVDISRSLLLRNVFIYLWISILPLKTTFC